MIVTEPRPTPASGAGPRAASSVAVRAAGLGERYGEAFALAALELAVERGEVYGHLGPS
jgi:hypothetical protein